MGADVFFTGEDHELVESGKLIPLCVICYEPAEDRLILFPMAVRPKEETFAILKKYFRGKVHDV